jgi:aminodeoxyfutalosine deaminase
LPKADIHVRLDGAVSPAFVHERLSTEARATLPPALRDASSPAAFTTVFREHPRDPAFLAATKDAWLTTLQSADSLRAAVAEIVANAAADGVTYLELAVRPTAHTASSLALDDVVSLVSSALATAATDAGIDAGLVLVAKPVADSPLAVHAIATAAVAATHDEASTVVGFALYGDESFMTSRVTDYYGDALSLLKANNIPVAASAGQQDGASVMAALQVAGACRISGAFVVHAHPDIVAHLAQHRVPVELSPSPQMRLATADVVAFQRTSPFRVLLDQGVRVSLCTVRGGLARHSRVETLEYLVRSSNLSAADVCTLLANGFTGAFAPLATRRRLEAKFWEEARRLLPGQTIRARRFFPAPSSPLK